MLKVITLSQSHNPSLSYFPIHILPSAQLASTTTVYNSFLFSTTVSFCAFSMRSRATAALSLQLL